MSDLKQFDSWLSDDGPAALVLREQLESVEGPDAVIFPPTFAPENDGEKSGYNIDRFGSEFQADAKWNGREMRGDYNVRFTDDGGNRNVCLINSVGAEANRTEVVFKPDRCQGKYAHLVPQVNIIAGGQKINLLDAGHRAGDALVRFTSYGETLWDAFKAYLEAGNAEPLVKAAPTSVVFGVWDSRGTQAKLPRIYRSVVRAMNVRPVTRSAQFNRATKYTENGLIKEELDKGKGDQNPLSREGFNDSPAGNTHGGVIVDGEIRREICINLCAIRRLRVPDKKNPQSSDHERTLNLRRYVLGLALVAATARNDDRFDLREGCQLRIKKGSSAEWRVIAFEGDDKPTRELSSEGALKYADAAAKGFGVGASANVEFDKDAADRWLRLKKEDQEKRRRTGPMTKQFK